jgi:hypothetical protein
VEEVPDGLAVAVLVAVVRGVPVAVPLGVGLGVAALVDDRVAVGGGDCEVLVVGVVLTDAGAVWVGLRDTLGVACAVVGVAELVGDSEGVHDRL